MSVDYRLQGRWVESLHRQDELRHLVPPSIVPRGTGVVAAVRPEAERPRPRPTLREASGTLTELHRTPW
ncbi:MAG: hypothetical protein ACRDM1_01900 [Gaiellaceae bacterium]